MKIYEISGSTTEGGYGDNDYIKKYIIHKTKTKKDFIKDVNEAKEKGVETYILANWLMENKGYIDLSKIIEFSVSYDNTKLIKNTIPEDEEYGYILGYNELYEEEDDEEWIQIKNSLFIIFYMKNNSIVVIKWMIEEKLKMKI